MSMDTLVRYSWIAGVLGFGAVLIAAARWWVYGDIGAIGTTLCIVGAVLLVAYAALDRERIAEGTTARQALYGSGALLVVVMGTGLGFAVVQLARVFDERWDLSSTGRYTLSTQTLSVLDGLGEDVAIYGIFERNTRDDREFRTLVEAYTAASGRVHYEAVDPFRDHLRATELTRSQGNDVEQAAIREGGAVILVAGGRRQRLETHFTEEDKLTNAIVRVLSAADHKVCWSRGHGELNPDDAEDLRGMGTVVLKAEDQNYAVSFTEVRTQGIAKDCEVVVIARPTLDWEEQERETLAMYVAGGGRVLILLDGLLDMPVLPGFTGDLERYGIRIGDDVVVEQDPRHLPGGSFGAPLYVYYNNDLPDHPITRSLARVDIGFFPRSVAPIPGTDGVRAEPLLVSSASSWAENDFDADGNLEPLEPGEDEKFGSVPMGVAVVVERPSVLDAAPVAPADGAEAPAASVFDRQPGGRLVVLGDADFATNGLSSLGNNDDLFLNALAWLVEENDQLGARPQTLGERDRFVITESESRSLAIVAVGVVPGGALLLGLLVFWRRRRL